MWNCPANLCDPTNPSSHPPQTHDPQSCKTTPILPAPNPAPNFTCSWGCFLYLLPLQTHLNSGTCFSEPQALHMPSPLQKLPASTDSHGTEVPGPIMDCLQRSVLMLGWPGHPSPSYYTAGGDEVSTLPLAIACQALISWHFLLELHHGL